MSMRDSRLDIRTTVQAKESIEAAASFLGITTSAFVLQCAMEKATKVLEQAQTIHLNAKEAHLFLACLENPPKPNDKLKKLFELHDNIRKK